MRNFKDMFEKSLKAYEEEPDPLIVEFELMISDFVDALNKSVNKNIFSGVSAGKLDDRLTYDVYKDKTIIFRFGVRPEGEENIHFLKPETRKSRYEMKTFLPLESKIVYKNSMNNVADTICRTVESRTFRQKILQVK